MSDAAETHSSRVLEEFAHRADSFARSPTMSLAETLDAVVELVPEDRAAHWAELACGAGFELGDPTALDVPAIGERAERP